MTYTKENIQQGIQDKINSLHISKMDKDLLKLRIMRYPSEIEQNVLEWINNQPLSDIDCHGESILKIMNLWGFSEKDIPQLICGFGVYAKTDWTQAEVIWQEVTGLQVVYD